MMRIAYGYDSGPLLTFCSASQDFRQISELYQTIPSPSPSSSSLSSATPPIIHTTMERLLGGGASGTKSSLGSEVWELDGDLEAMGLKTELYGYQRVSIEVRLRCTMSFGF
jgi:hypothetical protein